MPNITGTILTPGGAPVQGVVVSLHPEGSSPGAAQAIAGRGILLTPDRVQTDAAGEFAIPVLPGFRYRLAIEAIGYSRSFVAPESDTRFDLLGLTPYIEAIIDWTSDGATGVVLDPDALTMTRKVALTIKADALPTVMERFKLIHIERSTQGQDGPWTEMATIELVAGEIFYSLTVDGAAETDWFRARYSNGGGDYSQYSDPRIADAEEEELLLSTDELRELYLFGTDLTDDDGNPFPERMLAHYIRAAVAWLEKELDIPLTPREIVEETHDHFANDYGRWGYFQLHHYPVIALRRVSFQYPSQTSRVVIDPRWVVLEEAGARGVIQIVPGQGNIADVLLIPGQLMPLWSGATGRVPGVWRFDYRAGFEAGALPADLKHAIGMQASIGVFNIAGDLIAGAGIANISMSIPGLSQSVGTTSSATNAGYGARIIEYQKELKELLPNLRRYYGKNTKMVVA